ncbi:MAG: hypothetical protein EOM21_17900, partial [Gammaproteobacteria bacterium]|nr:hypothetical protein [Gammaproteobacteria bacterium]
MPGCLAPEKDALVFFQRGGALIVGCLLLLAATSARSQDIEPRTYSNAPIGVSFLIAGYAYTRGGIAFDSALPVSDPEIATSNALLAYARVLDLWGKSGKIDFTGGRTSLDGIANDDHQSNWRLGGTVALPIDTHHSLKLYASSGVASRTGNDFDLIGIAWQYR